METYYYQTIINSEMNPIRFENFCIEICRKEKNITLVPTSKSWDLGRDAREILIGKKRPIYLCATLNKEIDSKVKNDINRLKETSEFESIIYCCSKELTEHAIEKLKTEIQSMFSTPVTLEIIGQIQIATLSEIHPDIFKNYYNLELRNIIKMISSVEEGEETVEQMGLRLALSTFASEDAVILRSNLLNRIVIEFLVTENNQSNNALSKKISDELHLPRPIQPGYLNGVLNSLQTNGLVFEENGKWSLTDNGLKEAKTVSRETVQHLLEGRNIIYKEIHQLTGHKLSDDQFNRVWAIIEDSLSELFYSNGLTIVQMIDSFLFGKDVPERYEEFFTLIERMADRITIQFSNKDQAIDVRQAIIDMFGDRTGEPFQWFTSICTAFISICALGFEGTSSAEIHRILKRTKVVIDTDVLLTLLCEGEPDHKDIQELLKRWNAIGGEIYVSYPVLEEVAYHAFISEKDYNETYNLLKTLQDEEKIHRYIINAFVRAFRFISGGRYDYKSWNTYIREYRGESEYDFNKILVICTEAFGFNILPDAGEEYEEFFEETKNFIVDSRKKPQSTAEKLQRITDKSKRDARMLASILRYRDTERKKGSGETMSIVTSSNLFRKADDKFKSKLGSPEAVLLISAFSYLISLLPGVHFNLNTFKSVLFDFNIRSKLLPDERMAMRVLKLSSNYEFPFSRRASLRRELELRLRQNAKKCETTINEERDKFYKDPKSDSDISYVAETISKALDGISEETVKEDKIIKVMQENTQLQKENEALRERLKLMSQKRDKTSKGA